MSLKPTTTTPQQKPGPQSLSLSVPPSLCLSVPPSLCPSVPPSLCPSVPPSLRSKTARLLTCLFLLLAPAGAAAQTSQPSILRDVGIDQKLNAQVPLDLQFRNEAGKTVQLSDYVRDKPVILTLVYYRCPMLCTLVLNGLVRTLKPLGFTVGREFDVVTVSFDPREGPELAAAKKENYVQSYGRPEAAEGWHFLVGDNEAVTQLAEAVGFRYAYDPATDQFAHASAVIVLTPQGRVSKYFYGIEYSTNDLRLGLTEASQNKIGSLAEQVLLFCYHYDPTTGKYGLAIMNIIRALGVLTVLGLGSFVFFSLRRDRRRRAAAQEVPT